MTDLEIEKIILLLQNTKISSYMIAKKTGLSQSIIGLWKKGKVKPSKTNANILQHFFEDENYNFNENSSKNVFADNIHNSTINQITNEKNLHDQLDECKKMLEFLKTQIETKDRTIEFLLKNQK